MDTQEEEISPDERIENALQEFASTHSSHKQRACAMASTLSGGADCGPLSIPTPSLRSKD